MGLGAKTDFPAGRPYLSYSYLNPNLSAPFVRARMRTGKVFGGESVANGESKDRGKPRSGIAFAVNEKMQVLADGQRRDRKIVDSRSEKAHSWAYRYRMAIGAWSGRKCEEK